MALRPSSVVQNLAIGAGSVASNAFIMVNQNTTYTESAAGPPTIPTGTTHVRLCATSDCYVVFGMTPTATVATGTLIPANCPEYFAVDQGEKVAVIQSSAGGFLNVVEMS
jgi:hypothetical protein